MNEFENRVKEYAIGRLRPDHIEKIFRPFAAWTLSDFVSSAHRRRSLAVRLEPGNATSYRFFLTELGLEEMKTLGLHGFQENSWLMCLSPGMTYAKHHVMAVSQFKLHPNYIESKLGVGPADSVVFSLALVRIGENLGLVDND